MTLCSGTTGCGCAIQSTTLSVIGSGTGVDPWTIDIVDSGAMLSFTPTLTASSGNPNLGSSGTRVGQYSQHGDMVYYEFAFLFSGTGILTGTGTYAISRPVLPSNLTGASMSPRGLCQVTDGFTLNVRNFALVFTQSPNELNLRPLNAASYAANALITNSNIGHTLQANSAITGQVFYHAA
jgi:hypothetical protein